MGVPQKPSAVVTETVGVYIAVCMYGVPRFIGRHPKLQARLPVLLGYPKVQVFQSKLSL